jgi:hypothetical protein
LESRYWSAVMRPLAIQTRVAQWQARSVPASSGCSEVDELGGWPIFRLERRRAAWRFAARGCQRRASELWRWLGLKPVEVSLEVEGAELLVCLSEQVAPMGTFP